MVVKDILNLYPKLIDIARYHNATTEEAEDVVQDVYLKLQEIEKEEGDLDRLTYKGKINMVYLFNTVRNMVYNKKRHTNRIYCIDDFEPEIHPHSMIETEVNNKLNDMGAYYHSLYDAYFNDIISMRELAKRSKISLTTIFYGVKHLKDELKPIFYDSK